MTFKTTVEREIVEFKKRKVLGYENKRADCYMDNHIQISKFLEQAMTSAAIAARIDTLEEVLADKWSTYEKIRAEIKTLKASLTTKE